MFGAHPSLTASREDAGKKHLGERFSGPITAAGSVYGEWKGLEEFLIDRVGLSATARRGGPRGDPINVQQAQFYDNAVMENFLGYSYVKEGMLRRVRSVSTEALAAHEYIPLGWRQDSFQSPGA